MAGYKLENFSKIEALLAPGEAFLAGGIGLAPGGMRRHAMGTGFGGVVGAVAASTDKPTAGDFDLPNKFVLALTNQRLLFCQPANGSPTTVLSAIALNEVASIGQSKGGVVTNKNTITLRDGRQLVFDSGRAGVGKWMNDVVAEVQPLLAAD